MAEVESETYEEKSSIEWSEVGKQFDLLKTIIAFANCEGGVIFIAKFIGDEALLDSARLHDFSSKYVDPAISGISSEKGQDGSWKISVTKSPFAPHVIKMSGNYKKNGKDRAAFYPGQVFVRHSSKSEPASAIDLQRIIREGVSSWLGSLGAAVARVGLSSAEGVGVPMRIVEGGPALSIGIDESHPYSASDIGEPFGKTGAWIGKLITKEGMRDDRRYSLRLKQYKQPMYCFSEAAKAKVAELLSSSPEYNPYS